MKPKYNKAILFSSFGIILSAGIASAVAACKDENNISSEIANSRGQVIKNSNNSLESKVVSNENKFIGSLTNSYFDRDKGIVNIESPLIKKFDDSKISDAYYGANGIVASKEVAAKTLLPDYKLVKKYTYNNLNKFYDSQAELEKEFWNNIDEPGIAFYAIKDKAGKNNYFNPLNPYDVYRFKLFAVNEFLKTNNLFDLDYYLAKTANENETEYVGFKNASYLFSDDGNLTLSSNSNSDSSAFNQKINSFFERYVANLLDVTKLTPTISIPSNPLKITNRTSSYKYGGYKNMPEIGFDKYFGIGVKKDNNSWNDVQISSQFKFNESFNPDTIASELSKISNKTFIANNFNTVSLNQRYKRNNEKYPVSNSSLSPNSSEYGHSIINEQYLLIKDFAAPAFNSKHSSISDSELSKKLDQAFLKHHAHINNNSFVTKDNVKIFGESIGLIYKGNLYASTNKGDSSLAEDAVRLVYFKGKKYKDPLSTSFIYNKKELSFDRDSEWFTGGSFDKSKFVNHSKNYFGFGELKDANASYGNYPKNTAQISNNTVQVGADVFDVNSGRRNISNIVHDLKKRKTLKTDVDMTFLPRYWESYRIAEQDRLLFLNVDLDFKFNNKSYKKDDLPQFRNDIRSKFGLTYNIAENKYAIDRNSDFYKEYLKQVYVFGIDTYTLFSKFNNFYYINRMIDENFLKIATQKVEQFIKLFETSQAKLALGKNNDNSFNNFKNNLSELKQVKSKFDNSKVIFNNLQSSPFLYENSVNKKAIKIVLTYGSDKQPIFELNLNDPTNKNKLANYYLNSNGDFKKALGEFISQMSSEELDKSFINLSNNIVVDKQTYRPVYKYDLSKEVYFTTDKETKELKLKPEYDNSLELIEPNLPKDTKHSETAKFISDGNNWYPVTYLWKLYNKNLKNSSNFKKEIFKDSLFDNPNNFFVLRDSTLSFTDLNYGKYFEIDGKYKNISLDPKKDAFNLFFDSHSNRIVTKSFTNSSIDIGENYQIAYYYLNDTNEKLGITVGENTNEEELQNQAKLSALAEIKPKLAVDKKIYKNDDKTEVTIDNVVFNLFPFDTGKKKLYFDSKENLEKYKSTYKK